MHEEKKGFFTPWRNVVLGLLAVAVIGGLVAWVGKGLVSPPTGPKFPLELSDVILPSPKIIKPFQLVDQDRNPFGLEQLKGNWTFLFFGYTHCPDVCPLALGMLAELFERLKTSAPDALERTRVAFISVDPKRDTTERLKQYVLYFNPAFKGVTGTEKAIKAFSRQLGALYFMPGDFKGADGKPVKSGLVDPNAKTPEEDEGYQVSHTSAFFLVDPLGRLVAIFPEYNNTDIIQEEYVRIRKFVKIRNIYGDAERAETGEQG